MARTKTRVNYSNFIKGKYSDFNPIYPVENAVRTLLNVDVELNGKAGRRLGLEPETNFNLPVDVNSGDTSTWLDGYTLDVIKDQGIDNYEWKSVDNVSGLTYRVVRIGNTLYVYDEGGSVLSNSLKRVIDISGFATINAEDAAKGSFSATSGKGLLICAGEGYEPFYVKYVFNTDTWSTTQINIKIRDFEGVDDGLEIEERPVNLSNEHKYNLLNQGWTDTIPVTKNADTPGPTEYAKRYNNFKERFNVYPSNVDIEYFGKGVGPGGDLLWDARSVYSLNAGNTRATQGHFIVNPFNGYSRQTASGVPLTGQTSTTKRPKAVQFYAGRIWYGAVDGVIFYSKIIESERDLGLCYQQQDPTAEDINQLLDTDGGTLKIFDMGECDAMSVMGDALVVLGEGGVWVVSGGETGFTANNQMMANITKVSASGYRSIISTGSQVYYWSDEGIFVISPDFQVKSLTLNRLQRDYNKIPSSAKAVAQGAYDRKENKIYWSFNYHTEDYNTDFINKYTNILIYSITLDAFWDYTLTNEGYTDEDTSYPVMCGLFTPAFRSTGEAEENVTVPAGSFILSGAGFANSKHISSGDVVTSLVDTHGQNGLWKVVYASGIGKWVACSTQSLAFTQGNTSIQILSSPDGINWTKETQLPINAGDGSFQSVTSIGYSEALNRLVVIDSYSRYYADASNLTSWTQVRWVSTGQGSTPFIGAGFSIARSDDLGLFVAGTQTTAAGEMLYSSDGITWSASPSNLVDNVTRLCDTQWIPEYSAFYAIGYGNSSTNNVVLKSVDGINWTLLFSVSPGTSTSRKMVTFAYSPDLDRFTIPTLGASDPERTYYSDDGGVTWNTNSTNWYSGTAGQMSHCRWLPNEQRFIAGGNTGLIVSSTDGIDWEIIQDPGLSSNVDYYAIGQASGEEIVTEDGENVTVTIPVVRYSSSGLKVAMLLPDDDGTLRLTFGQFSSRAFHDWDSLTQDDLEDNTNYTVSFPVSAMDSGNYQSVVETLPDTLGEPSLQKQGTYIHTYYDYIRGGYGELIIPDEFDA